MRRSFWILGVGGNQLQKEASLERCTKEKTERARPCEGRGGVECSEVTTSPGRLGLPAETSGHQQSQEISSPGACSLTR